jgi:hypothetical protein
MDGKALKTGILVKTLDLPKFASPVTVGIARGTHLPLLEQRRTLEKFNEAEGTSLRIISPMAADACLAATRDLFVEAGRFLTSGVVFYPSVNCHLHDSIPRGATYLSFHSGKTVVLEAESFGRLSWEQNAALMIGDIGQCPFSYVSGLFQITAPPEEYAKVGFPLGSGWFLMNLNGSWKPYGEYRGEPENRMGKREGGMRLLLRGWGPNASPIIRDASVDGGVVVYMDGRLTDPAGMVVEMEPEDVAKFPGKR